MSAEFPFNVGDRVRWTNWPEDCWLEVLYVGATNVFGREQTGAEVAYLIDPEMEGHHWERYVEPLVFPERWINVYRFGLGDTYEERAFADAFNRDPNRLGVIHLYPDGTLEMETP